MLTNMLLRLWLVNVFHYFWFRIPFFEKSWPCACCSCKQQDQWIPWKWSRNRAVARIAWVLQVIAFSLSIHWFNAHFFRTSAVTGSGQITVEFCSERKSSKRNTRSTWHFNEANTFRPWWFSSLFNGIFIAIHVGPRISLHICNIWANTCVSNWK